MPELPSSLPDLDPVIHGKLRLALLSLLAGVEQAEFTWLKEKTNSTDGNLGAHLVTLYAMTSIGRDALANYVAALRSLLGAALV
jgi:hypothetical protein